jgi:5'-nucleotidase
MQADLPLILLTNDDGIQSDGLWAAVEALLPLGQVLVVAPDRQWSGGGRSMPPHVTGHVQDASCEVCGQWVTAYAVDASPALAVQHGVVELAPRRPDLVVSGINYGLNMGTEVTVSGTVGAALEGGAFGIPSLAVSLEMDPVYHLSGDDTADYAAAIAYTRLFAWYQLTDVATHDVDALSINVPADARPDTPWRFTRISRRRFFVPIAPDRAHGKGRPGYQPLQNLGDIELDSDIWAVKVNGVVSVSPLSLDLTARIDLSGVGSYLRNKVAFCQQALNSVARLEPRLSVPQRLDTLPLFAEPAEAIEPQSKLTTAPDRSLAHSRPPQTPQDVREGMHVHRAQAVERAER